MLIIYVKMDQYDKKETRLVTARIPREWDEKLKANGNRSHEIREAIREYLGIDKPKEPSDQDTRTHTKPEPDDKPEKKIIGGGSAWAST